MGKNPEADRRMGQARGHEPNRFDGLLGIGSNVRGLGREATQDGHVLGSPHFPWDGSERLYRARPENPPLRSDHTLV